MRTIYPGHRYALNNLKSIGQQELQFRQDAPLHPERKGTSCQEVIRCLIDRVQCLDAEEPWFGNAYIIHHLRQSIAYFEARALIRKTEKGLEVEALSVGPDGHLVLTT